MAPPRRAAAAARLESESRTRQDAADTDTRWLQTLSEPELDLLIGLKELAVTRASNAGNPDLADKVFHLRALRALAFVLLEESKQRLRQAAASSANNASMLERLALLNDPEDVMPIHKKRKQMQDGCDGEGARSPKRRKATSLSLGCQTTRPCLTKHK